MGQHQTPLCPLIFTMVVALFMVSSISAETWYVTPLSQCVENSTIESCHTLSQVAANTERYSTDNITLILLSGEHILDSELLVRDITNFEISVTSNTNVTVTCSESGRLSVNSVFTVHIRDLVFIGCMGNSITLVDHFLVENCEFHGLSPVSVSGVTLQLVSSAEIKSSIFSSHKSAIGCAVIYAYNSTISIDDSSFQSNAVIGGGIGGAICGIGSQVSINNSTFTNNSAGVGGALVVDNGVVNYIHNSMFINNRASYGGGAIGSYVRSVERKGSVMAENCSFIGNEAEGDGGALLIQYIGNVILVNTKFINNSITSNRNGVAINIHKSSLTTRGFLEIENSKGGVGVVYALQSEMLLSGTNTITNNCGSFLVIGCNVKFRGTTNFMYNRESSHTKQTIEGQQQGGAVTALNSEVAFQDTVSLIGNQADNGGAILAIQSTLYVIGNTIISDNHARLSGGGIYGFQSELKIIGSNSITDNTASNKGGGIHAIGLTTQLLQGVLNFTRNHASRGGGMLLESDAKLYIVKPAPEICGSYSCIKQTIHFIENSADYGGAVYVTDNITSGTCASNPFSVHSTASSECFVQIFTYLPSTIQHPDIKLADVFQNVYFTNNTAEISGQTLYGGLLDRCTINPISEITQTLFISPSVALNVTNGGIYIVTDIKKSAIESDPVRVCFCNEGKPDCSYQPDTVRVRKGEKFVVPAVAVDQVDRPTPSTIHSSLKYGTFGEEEEQQLQDTFENCTDLHYNILSTNDSAQLKLYAEGPCKDIGISQRFIYVNFLPCDCPIGFEPSNITSNCLCVCDSAITNYTSGCHVETDSVVRKSDFWITHKNSTANKTGYVVYKHCPFDYCYPPTKTVPINLSNHENGSDAQCAFNRSGVLCGKCIENFSLVLGSSQCLDCSNLDSKLTLLIPFAIAGIALVAFLLVFNLTVAVGTINGLIFYANVVIANSALFFPVNKTIDRFLIIFIAWLNLDLGIETCFYDGMDGLEKVGLQVVFPLYIIFLVAMVIIISDKIMIRSNSWWTTRALHRLLSNTNPVATLATLILLSYAKLLRTIIVALLSTTPVYPDDSNEKVWQYDGNIPYLNEKHVHLFNAALVILFISLVYTFFLIFWQCLIRCKCPTNTNIQSNGLIQRLHTVLISRYWRTYTALNNFIETYHAPYVTTHRYWTGLLLLARVVLYLITSLTDDPRVSLLSTICVVGVLLLWKSITKQTIFKNWLLNAVESLFLFNLLVFSAGTLYLQLQDTSTSKTQQLQAALYYVSTIISFIAFLGILVYHFPRAIYTIAKMFNIKAFKKFDSYMEFTSVKTLQAVFSKNKPNPAGFELEVISNSVAHWSETENELRSSWIEISQTSIDGRPDRGEDFESEDL